MKFEDFLRRKFNEGIGSMVSDDLMETAFVQFMDMDIAQMMTYADEWGEELTKEVRAMVEDECKRK